MELLIKEKLENFREFREQFSIDFRRKITLQVHCFTKIFLIHCIKLADQRDQEHNEAKGLLRTEKCFHDNGQSCLKQTY